MPKGYKRYAIKRASLAELAEHGYSFQVRRLARHLLDNGPVVQGKHHQFQALAGYDVGDGTSYHQAQDVLLKMKHAGLIDMEGGQKGVTIIVKNFGEIC